MEFVSTSVNETEALARNFAKKLKHGDFIAMYGDMGAGKTAFTRGLCSQLCPNEYVSSPTYTVVNEYAENGIRVCHFDMYRITDEDELYSIGFYDYTDCIIVCEWTENIEYALPHSYYKVTITADPALPDTRKIVIEEPGC